MPRGMEIKNQMTVDENRRSKSAAEAAYEITT